MPKKKRLSAHRLRKYIAMMNRSNRMSRSLGMGRGFGKNSLPTKKGISEKTLKATIKQLEAKKSKPFAERLKKTNEVKSFAEQFQKKDKAKGFAEQFRSKNKVKNFVEREKLRKPISEKKKPIPQHIKEKRANPYNSKRINRVRAYLKQRSQRPKYNLQLKKSTNSKNQKPRHKVRGYMTKQAIVKSIRKRKEQIKSKNAKHITKSHQTINKSQAASKIQKGLAKYRRNKGKSAPVKPKTKVRNPIKKGRGR